MEGFVVYGDKQGCGYVTTDESGIMQSVRKQEVILAGEKLTPGQYTDLRGYFIRKMPYLGMLGSTEMIFYLGSYPTLFGTKHYYQCVFRIAEDRIFEMFSPISGRDHYYIKGKWK